MNIFPGARISPLDASTVRIEFGTLPALTISELLPAELHWLLRAFDQPNNKNSNTAKRTRAAISVESQRELEKLLISKGFARAKARSGGGFISPSITAEVLAQYAIATSERKVDPRDLIARRANATIAFKHVSRTTLESLRVLVGSGVFRFIIDDPRPNIAVDLFAVPGFSESIGSIQDATEDFVRSLHPQVTVLSAQCRPTFTVLGSEPDPAYLDSALLTSHGAPHLVVTIDSKTTTIGPLVSPSQNTSLCCYQHQLSPKKPSHALEPQFQTVGLPTVQSSVNAVITGAIVANHVLNYLDGVVPSSAVRLTRTSHRANTPSYENLLPDPSCFCSNVTESESLI